MKTLYILYAILFACFWIEYQTRIDMQVKLEQEQDDYEDKVIQEQNNFERIINEQYYYTLKYLIWLQGGK